MTAPGPVRAAIRSMATIWGNEIAFAWGTRRQHFATAPGALDCREETGLTRYGTFQYQSERSILGEDRMRWGLIGASTIAAQHMVGAIRATGGEIVAVVSTQQARAAEFAQTHGIGQAFSRVDGRDRSGLHFLDQ
jgi:hypothetical protein